MNLSHKDDIVAMTVNDDIDVKVGEDDQTRILHSIFTTAVALRPPYRGGGEMEVYLTGSNARCSFVQPSAGGVIILRGNPYSVWSPLCSSDGDWSLVTVIAALTDPV